MSCIVADWKFIGSGISYIPVALACFCSFLFGVIRVWSYRSRNNQHHLAFRSRFVGGRRVPATSRRLRVHGRMVTVCNPSGIHVHYQIQHGRWKVATFYHVDTARKFIDSRHQIRLSTMPFDCWVSSPRCGQRGIDKPFPSACILRQDRANPCRNPWLAFVAFHQFYTGLSRFKTLCKGTLGLTSTILKIILCILWIKPMALCVCIRKSLCPDWRQSSRTGRRDLSDRRHLRLKKLALWLREVGDLSSIIQLALVFCETFMSALIPIHVVSIVFCLVLRLFRSQSNRLFVRIFSFLLLNSNHMDRILWLGDQSFPNFRPLQHFWRIYGSSLGLFTSWIVIKWNKVTCGGFPSSQYSQKPPRHFSWFGMINTLNPRIGEADNPGPFWNNPTPDTMNDGMSEFLWIGACNPTQLLGKEEVCASWGQGIWTFAETSTTPKAASAIQSRFRKFGSSVIFGDHVRPQTSSTLFRGRAGGVAISSGFPVRRYLQPQPAWLSKSTRFVDAVVHVQGHIPIYVSSIYGVAGKSSSHPLELTEDIMNQAADRALKYKGPAIICGDFNVDISGMLAWKNLELQGWHDLALLDSKIFGRPTQPTSKFGNRHSYILANSEMCKSFMSCRTCEDYDFDSHPLLVSCFRVKSLISPAKQWVLPQSLDQFLFDENSIMTNAQSTCHYREHLFDPLLKKGDMDGAARQLTLAIEETLQKSAVDVEGNSIHIPPGFLGRGLKSPLIFKRNFVPVVKPGRHGDFMPLMSQSTKGLRSYIKQLRRIQALKQQLSSYSTSQNIHALYACEKLWNVILDAHGFRGGFPQWINDHLDQFVPLSVPSLDFVSQLLECFQKYLHLAQHDFFLKQSSVKKLNLLIDIEQGGRECFRAVRDEPVPPLASITWTNRFAIPKIRWNKEGTKILPFHGGCKVDPLFPITFQGQTRSILKVHQGKLVLDKPVTLKNNQDNFFTQTITSADIQDVHKGLIHDWSKLWNRDPDTDGPENWPLAAEFVSSLQDCPSCPFQELNEDVWFESLKGVKKLTARGADGFSTRDCFLIRGDLISWLIKILKSIEDGSPWPHQWILARVVVLSKGCEPKSPLDIRPISVLSKFYRLWSRLRSLEVLRHIGGLMPPQVSATSGGVSADLLAAYTADQIENSHFHGQWMCGLVIDLVKCYNLVPWLPSQWIFQKLGVPKRYITAMFSFLKGLSRTFDFHGDCSDLVTASNGIAEGCALSVSLMTALSWFCHKIMEEAHPCDIAVCYADNWGVNSYSPENLRSASQTLEKICLALKMVISIPKSWFWTTNRLWKSRLKTILVQGECLQIKDSAVDLGCDQNYGKRRVLSSQKKRIAKAKRVMQRIQKKKIPRHFRATMTQSCGFGAFAYGQSLQYVPFTTWKSLRSATVGAIHRNGGCSAPFLACLFHNFPIDPQLKGIIRTLCFWRKFFHVFPGTSTDFCNRLVWESNYKGPAQNLKQSLVDIGWHCLNNGYIRHTSGAQFNWMSCSESFLKKFLRQFWSSFVAEKTNHRKDFDIGSIDDLNITRSLRKFEPSQRSLLTSYMTGTACTNDFKAKFSPEVSNKCDFCGLNDSRLHRVFECEHLKETRMGNGKFLAWLRQQPEATKKLMLFEQNWSLWKLLQQHQLEWPNITTPVFDEQAKHIFCDGSAYWQDQPCCTISGIGVIESGWLEYKHKILFQRPLPGLDHNSYRAECFAILMVLSHVSKPIIYSDCLAAVDCVLHLVSCHRSNIKPRFHDHQDIWLQVWRQIQSRPPDFVTMVKTKAHEDPKKIFDPVLKWQAVMNNRVDLVAKAAVTNWSPVFEKAECVHQYITRQTDRFVQHSKLILAQAEYNPQKAKKMDPPEEKPDWSTRAPCPGICRPFELVTPEVTCPFGNIFLDRVIGWAKNLKWPENSQGQISILELYIDFTLFTKSLAPVSLPPENKKYKCCYKLSDIDKLAAVTPQSLAQQSIVWNRFIKWSRSNGILLWEHDTISKSYVLAPFGYALWAPAVQGHPVLTSGDKVYQIVYDLFVTPTGRRRNLNIPYNCPS